MTLLLPYSGPSHEYHFLTRWQTDASVPEVFNLLSLPEALPKWWPEVYLDVREIEPSSEGAPARFELLTKGKLPYKLRWQMSVVEVVPDERIEIRAEGDFVGRGTWQLSTHRGSTVIEFEWQIAAQKPLLRRLSFLLKPLFAWNHCWAMDRGAEGLNRILRDAHRNPSRANFQPSVNTD